MASLSLLSQSLISCRLCTRDPHQVTFQPDIIQVQSSQFRLPKTANSADGLFGTVESRTCSSHYRQLHFASGQETFLEGLRCYLFELAELVVEVQGWHQAASPWKQSPFSRLLRQCTCTSTSINSHHYLTTSKMLTMASTALALVLIKWKEECEYAFVDHGVELRRLDQAM